MESLSNEKLLTYLVEIESSAEDVLSDKQEIVDLDRKRQMTREAIRAVDRQSKQDWKGDQSKMWMAVGNTFFKLPSRTADEMLKKGELQSYKLLYCERKTWEEMSCFEII